MREHAPSLQANAMVGVRFDATEVIPGLMPGDQQKEDTQYRTRIQTTRGLIILVARLTAKEHNRIFLLCHYFATTKQL
jgi:hypothetical protein